MDAGMRHWGATARRTGPLRGATVAGCRAVPREERVFVTRVATRLRPTAARRDPGAVGSSAAWRRTTAAPAARGRPSPVVRPAVLHALRLRAGRPALASALVALAVACGGGDTTTGPHASARLTFAMPSDTLEVGEHARLAPLVSDPSGYPVTESELRWSTSDSTIVRVTSAGIATGARVGVADVGVTGGGGRATLRVVVQRTPVASVTFEGAPAQVTAGAVVQMRAVARAASGAVLADRAVSYRLGGGAATVSAGGQLSATATGDVTVIAESEGRSATATVRVVEAGTTPAPAPSATPAPPISAGAGDGGFSIRVSWAGTPDPRASTVVDAVVARWRRAITGDLPNVSLSLEPDACYDGQPASRETVDDLLVYVRVVAIDGASGTLARAGPCMVRGGRGLPVVGVIELDSADLGRSATTVLSVLTHEFGHVLGIGTLWEYKTLLHGKDTGDPLFLGETARDAYAAMGGSGLAPVENTGGEGTKHGHWRESTFRTELMTGWINAGTNAMSTLTIASLRDLGYAVDMGAAEAYALPSAVGASPRLEGVAGERLADELITPRFVVDADGRSRRIAR